ncbi:Phytoene desaturase (lycopene-forming) [Aquisphaera giovannonii]|uniref:Phytoene desaturase (Lycopene-forming) n=1 Tax=Aquisphaera giovannonii TaxID=406548 RepID=A0A5B9W3M9_9BACT|nr:NAD(P)/FAD-dependent oxidoreductase [Aquisphaera giovannonii]QEH34711.1 Phytoene desaturase (lycopene-forming) [Aquisphaera giovannonii]
MIYDLVVIGGGIGGLATAALAQGRGLRTALLEAHTRLGGCAGYFDRGPFTFDAGATAIMGLGVGEPVGDLLAAVGLEFDAAETPSYRVHLPDRSIDIVPDATEFLARDAEAFGPEHARRRRAFWSLQAAVGGRLFRAAGRVPRLPARSAADLWHDLKALGLPGLAAASTAAMTVLQVLRILGLDRDLPFRSFVAMLLQDTAQAGPETVPFANAAACLQAYRLGMRRPRGGMKALAEGLGRRFAGQGGDIRTATIVDRVEARTGEDDDADGPPGGFVVTTRRRDRLSARQVAFNLPLDLAARLLGRSLEGRLARDERKSRAAWSAFTGYLAICRSAIDDDAPLFHQVLRDYDAPSHDGNNVLISLSPPGDEAYGPPGVRVATMSTHTRPADWAGLDRETYGLKKADFRDRLLDALARALPDVPAALVHDEFASPRSFRRYTRRAEGAVGGAPVSRWNSNALAVGSDVLGPGLWVVGDSVFPGQGTMAVVLSAIRVVERVTGRPWTPRTATHRREPVTGRANLQPQP